MSQSSHITPLSFQVTGSLHAPHKYAVELSFSDVSSDLLSGPGLSSISLAVHSNTNEIYIRAQFVGLSGGLGSMWSRRRACLPNVNSS